MFARLPATRHFRLATAFDNSLVSATSTTVRPTRVFPTRCGPWRGRGPRLSLTNATQPTTLTSSCRVIGTGISAAKYRTRATNSGARAARCSTPGATPRSIRRAGVEANTFHASCVKLRGAEIAYCGPGLMAS